MDFKRRLSLIAMVAVALLLAVYSNGEDQEIPHNGLLSGILDYFRTTPEEEPRVLISPKQVYPGQYLAVYIEPLPAGEAELSSPLVAHQLPVYAWEEGAAVLVPVDYRRLPSDYELTVTIANDGESRIISKAISVLPFEFPVQHLNVSPNLQARRDESLWEEDRQHTNQARAHSSSEPLWQGLFKQPVPGRITTGFGTIRYINDVESGRHSGLDIAARQGTPVTASNAGRVVLATGLNVTGNTVMIDHGLNLFSSYSHLDEIRVDLGQFVASGEEIGTVGSTGFSTGPHLHWALSIGSTFVNPDCLQETDPKALLALLRSTLASEQSDQQ